MKIAGGHPVSKTGANDSSITSKMARNDVTTVEPGEGTEQIVGLKRSLED